VTAVEVTIADYFFKVWEILSIGVRARRMGAAAPETRAKPLFFGQKLNFSGRSQQPKMRNIFFEAIKRKNGIHSV